MAETKDSCQWLLNCLNSPEEDTTVEKFEEFTKKARTVCEADPESFDNDVLFKSISLSCLDDNPEQGMKKTGNPLSQFNVTLLLNVFFPLDFRLRLALTRLAGPACRTHDGLSDNLVEYLVKRHPSVSSTVTVLCWLKDILEFPRHLETILLADSGTWLWDVLASGLAHTDHLVKKR